MNRYESKVSRVRGRCILPSRDVFQDENSSPTVLSGTVFPSQFLSSYAGRAGAVWLEWSPGHLAPPALPERRTLRA